MSRDFRASEPLNLPFFNFLEFFRIVNYNIENWVWKMARTRTLATLCCMLSGFVSSFEDSGLLG